ncbi:succinate-semialdehyde dehydrogenase (NADP(+)) [Rhizobium rhizosphaerae]|uniref:Succinate-semialdehyde dehydrogenase (NADP(+)) n=2 Tax=Rhizobium/Agrobacterium group TaxID=227290 RepID=A0ABX3P8B3_9HYPH|nr:NAD-dependent succinate-semialdehyde dehydrogenase [Xaviernesmea rhizosphaerae]OQP84474.1 succinate-semialdehyde dehydrogenase (NADP(+)) [Xaviernesmea rhizosphaerae]
MRQLKDPELLRTLSYMDGAWHAPEATFVVRNPSTGEEIAQVADVSADDFSHVIAAAKTAQAAWAACTGKERAAVLNRWYREIVANVDDLATILTSEMGKPFAEAKAEILYGAGYIEWYSEEAKRIYGATIPGHQRDKRILVLKQPIGVVGAVTPWNFPNAMVTRKAGPALAVGCAIVLRPSEFTPLSALALAELAERAGLPRGVFNVVTCLDAEAFGKALCTHPDVAKISFTGSTKVGRILMQQAAGQIKKLSLELGGNAPFIVFDDADLDAAVEGAIAAKFRNGGQTCVCANRIYVQDGIHDRFADKLARRIGELRVADGFTDGADIGPMINRAAVRKLDELLEDALSKGGTVVASTDGTDVSGTFFKPTLVTGASADMHLARYEIFGPLIPLFRFQGESEVLQLANATEFGLAGYFYSQDITRIWRMAEKLEVGMIGINTGQISTEVAPFGGIKQSGLGREGSFMGADDYLEVKYLCFGGVE